MIRGRGGSTHPGPVAQGRGLDLFAVILLPWSISGAEFDRRSKIIAGGNLPCRPEGGSGDTEQLGCTAQAVNTILPKCSPSAIARKPSSARSSGNTRSICGRRPVPTSIETKDSSS